VHKDATQPEPAPAKNDRRVIQDLVIEDIQRRKAQGLAKYGTLLQAFNGRDALVDLYQELLDACQYVRQLIEERDLMPANKPAPLSPDERYRS
jgi:hypothetical protein